MVEKLGLDRRSFMKGAGVTALAGAAGTVATAPNRASAQNSISIPLHSNGNYDFDTPYNRVGQNTSRWDSPAKLYPEGVFKYGMGVATLDFECAPCITEALQERVQHHSWGYMSSQDGLIDGIVKWNGERHKIDIDPNSIIISAGVYPGIIAALRSFARRGSKVLLSTPTYSGFYGIARNAHVETVDSQMRYINGRYEINWEDLESKMTPDVAAMIVCNPNNPTGNVWTEEELLRMGRLSLDHGIMVISDEIHSDFVRAGHQYTPFANLPDQAVVNNSVTFNAISKTFNLAGMKNAYFYSKNPILLERVNQNHRADLTTLGVVANEAAYAEGAEWFEQANAYIDGSHTFIENYFRNNIPNVGYTHNEGTFMTFLDFSDVMSSIGAEERYMENDHQSPEHYFRDWLVYESGIYMNPGSSFGEGGAGHMRMNTASSRIVLQEVLDSLAAAVRNV
ncbi:MAG: aminotransferase class I/II-fold pyridoxal phosphate-dependent enzyme [Gammaproteobacteria bacterium]|jgi:cysteine-S-conjugate beta-lyase|nr:aminotransferase class I/II-fold pyridoxal phosphate-dependent enzyme [Gammaproteobacteria bacterium]